MLRSLRSKERNCDLRSLYSRERRGTHVDKIPAQQGSYLNKEARNWMRKKTRAYPGFGGSVHVTCIRRGGGGGAVGGDAK